MARILTFENHADSRGLLTVAEKELPFVPVRAFWITGADGQDRGGHGHKVTHLVLVAIAGSITVSVTSKKGGRFQLDTPTEGLHLEPEDWHTMEFGPGSALLALASHGYDANDYILTPPNS
jgi:hypothetical protein